MGVDADPAMVELARAEHPGLRVELVDAQDADALRAAVGRPLDAVLSNAAMHWMPRQDDLVAGIAGVLRPGGRLVAEMGGGANVAMATAAIRAGRAAVGLDPDASSPWTFPTPGEQASRLERHGFDVRLVQCFDRMTPLAPGDTTASWARMFGAALVADVPAQRTRRVRPAQSTPTPRRSGSTGDPTVSRAGGATTSACGWSPYGGDDGPTEAARRPRRRVARAGGRPARLGSE